MKATMKGFADTIVPQMKNFAKSKEVKDLKKNAMNMLINKGYEALDLSLIHISEPTRPS